IPKGRAAYEPNSLNPVGPREDPKRGFRSFAAHDEGDKLRVRPESFADHYSQARQFFMSQTEPEQNHIVAALTFELSKVETKAIRLRMLGQLANVDPNLASRVAAGLGHQGAIPPMPAAKPTRTDLPPSPPLSILAKAKPTLKGRLIGCLVSDSADTALVTALSDEVKKAGAKMKIVAPRLGGVSSRNGAAIEADFQLA